MKTKQWNELSTRQQMTARLGGAAQFALAVAAWADLAKRPAAQVNGRKGMWAAIIGINFVGPIAYFLRGRRPA